MATMTSAQQGQYQPQPQQQQQQQQQQMLPTVGNGISYNAISMTAQPPQSQQPGMNHPMVSTGAAAPATNNNSSSSSSSASISSSKSSASTSLSRDGSSSKSKKKKNEDREGVPPFFHGKKLRSGMWLQVCSVMYCRLLAYLFVSLCIFACV